MRARARASDFHWSSRNIVARKKREIIYRPNISVKTTDSQRRVAGNITFPANFMCPLQTVTPAFFLLFFSPLIYTRFVLSSFYAPSKFINVYRALQIVKNLIATPNIRVLFFSSFPAHRKRERELLFFYSISFHSTRLFNRCAQDTGAHVCVCIYCTAHRHYETFMRRVETQKETCFFLL